MIEINILPEESKKRIKTENVFNSLRKMLLFLTLIVLFVSTILLLARVALKYQADIYKNFPVAYESSSTKDSGTKEIENKVIQVKNIQEGFVDWYGTISDLTEILNKDIKLESFSIDRDSAVLSIAGVAKTREAFLQLKTDLENSGRYLNIDFPVKNLLEKENIKFDLKVNIKFI